MAFTVQQAAYLMGMREETVNKMISAGKLLTIKQGREDGDPTLIHETEISRFQHPWEHLFRIDQRMTAQQGLLEILKGRINEQAGIAWRSSLCEQEIAIETLQTQVGVLQSTVEFLRDQVSTLTKISDSRNIELERKVETFAGMVKRKLQHKVRKKTV